MDSGKKLIELPLKEMLSLKNGSLLWKKYTQK
jgi:hypothetical protein